MKSKLRRPDLVFRLKLVILLLEIAAPFVLYHALQSGNSWLATVCLAIIVLGLVGVIVIQ